MRLPIAIFSAALPLLSMVSTAVADDDELRSGKVIAVQERPYRLVHEFTVSAGVFPVDALYTGLSLGGSYSLHLSDIWAWEAVSFHYSGNVNTGLDVTLAERWSVAPTSNPEIEYLVGSHLVITPLFGKMTLFNAAILYASSYFALGGGVAHFSDGFRPQVSVGPGVRLFWGQVVSTRLDVRGSIVPDIPSGIDLVMHVSLSASFNFGTIRATDSEISDEGEEIDGFKVLNELYPLSDPELTKRPASGEENTE